jgi:hypothetical protein
MSDGYITSATKLKLMADSRVPGLDVNVGRADSGYSAWCDEGGEGGSGGDREGCPASSR